jgi:hypothetical protein
MSRILRRPLFRGGPVSSYGTGIASGLADGGRVALENGGSLWNRFKNWTSRNVPDNSGVTGASILENTWLQDGKKIYGKSSPYGNKPKIEDLVGTGYGMNQNFALPNEETGRFEYLYASGDDPQSESTDVFTKEWVDEDLIKENELKKEHKESGSEIPYDTWKAINAENKKMEQAEKSALTLGGSGGAETLIPGVTQEPEGDLPPPPEKEERYEINEEDVRAQAALFDKLLNEDYEKDLKSARISDASDYALKFFEETIGKGKGMKEAAGEVAGFALAKPSKTETVKEGKKKTKQTATVMAINDALAQGKSERSIDMLIAKSGLDLKNKKALVDYTKSLTKGFEALSTYIGDSNAISWAGKVKEGLLKAGLAGYPTVQVTSVDMKDENKFKFDPAEDVGKVFIETDTETAYIFDKDGNRKYVG